MTYSEEKGFLPIIVGLSVIFLSLLSMFLLFSSYQYYTGMSVSIGDSSDCISFSRTDSPSCGDSDGGVFSCVLGEVYNSQDSDSKRYSDFCIEDRILREYSCLNGEIVSSNITCSCLNGICQRLTE